MTKNLISLGRMALVRHLGSVTVANGYATNAGQNVKTGWYNEVLQSESLGFPLICVSKGRDLPPKPGPAGLIKYSGFNIVGAVETALDDYEDALDDLEHDLLLALVPSEGAFLRWLPRGVKNVTVGAPQQFPPGKGERAASVVVPIHLHIIIER